MTGRPVRILAISSAYGGAAAAMVQDGQVIAAGRVVEEHGLAAALPAMVSEVLAEAGGRPDLVAAIVGPGSFTGLRAGLAVAAGLALGAGVPAVGVTVAEAMAEAAGPVIAGRRLWTAIAARRGRVFIDAGGQIGGYPIESPPRVEGRIAVCGNAANAVAGALAARGADVMLTPFRVAAPGAAAAVALRRWHSELPPLALVPLYVDAPLARLPDGTAGR